MRPAPAPNAAESFDPMSGFVLKSASEIIWEGVRDEVARLEVALSLQPIARLSGAQLDRHIGAQLAHSIKTQRERLARNHARRQRVAARQAVAHV